MNHFKKIVILFLLFAAFCYSPSLYAINEWTYDEIIRDSNGVILASLDFTSSFDLVGSPESTVILFEIQNDGPQTLVVTGIEVDRVKPEKAGTSIITIISTLSTIAPGEQASFSADISLSGFWKGKANVHLSIIFEIDGTEYKVGSNVHWKEREASPDWTMFRYDPQHSGYSPSTAPGNDLLWSKTIAPASASIVDGKVFIGSSSYDAETGDLLWHYPMPGTFVERGSPAVVDGRVFLGNSKGTVYCLDEETGALLWTYQTGAGVTFPTVSDGRVYVASYDGCLYCLNAETGGLIWKFQTPKNIRTPPAVAEGKVYFASHLGKFYCVDAETGDLIWANPAGKIRSAPSVYMGRVYYGWGSGRAIVCLDANTGERYWSINMGDEVWSSPAVAGGRVYIGGDNGRLYCFNAHTGEVLWSYKTIGHIRSSPAIAGGQVFVGSNDDYFYCLNAYTGALVWSYPTGKTSYSSPAIAEGKVLIGSSDGTIYCFTDVT